MDAAADANVQGGHYDNALQAASAGGHEKTVQMLIDAGADVNAQGGYFGNALQAASAEGHDKTVQMLIDAGADVNAQGGDATSRTPLAHAAIFGHKGVVVTLLSNKCIDPDTQDRYGATPLSIAVRNCRAEVVKLLLGTGCVEINSRDCFGRTTLWWARKTGNADIAQLLLEYAETRHILLYESDISTEVGLTPNDGASRSCDVCTLSILEDDVYYHCEVCNGGDFDICLECYKIGGRCLEVNPKLIQNGQAKSN
jgi:ankyrin repeat protein